MKTIRIAHISDTHLGYRALTLDDDSGRNQRAVDIENAFHDAISDILQQDVDLVIHSGDLFHQARPSFAAQRTAIRELRRLVRAEIPVFVIGGNHDTPRLRTTSSVFSVLELAEEAISFVCGYDVESIPYEDLQLRITGVPHGKLIDPIAPSVFATPGVRNVLVTHGFVPDVQIQHRIIEPGEEAIAEELLDPKFDYIALGHYHSTSQQRPNAWYAGSTERIGWSDLEASPGYLLVELDDSGTPPRVEHIAVKSRPMIKLNPVDAELMSVADVERVVIEQLMALDRPDAMIRFELLNTSRATQREVRALLRRNARHLAWHIEPVHVRATVIGGGTDSLGAGLTALPEMFSQFIDVESTTGAMPSRVAGAMREAGLQALLEAIATMEDATTEDDVA